MTLLSLSFHTAASACILAQQGPTFPTQDAIRAEWARQPPVGHRAEDQCRRRAGGWGAGVTSGPFSDAASKTQYEISTRRLERTLIVIGDADIIRPEHAVEMFRLLPHGQLAVLPGTDHMTIVRPRPWRISMMEAFLDGK